MSETDVIEFLRFRDNKATLNEVAEGLGIKPYGSGSAFFLLQSLKEKGLVARDGDNWVSTKRVAGEGEAPATSPPSALSGSADVQRLMESLLKGLASAVTEARRPTDEWEVVEKPFEAEAPTGVKEGVEMFVRKPSLEISAVKALKGLPTGTFIDGLFLSSDGKPIGGIPVCGQFAITGLPGAGKSILVGEIAINVASKGKRVLFVTSEDTWSSATERFDLQSRFVEKAKFLGLNWNRISKNLYIMDTVSYPELREWEKFVETYRYVAEKEKIDLVIVDSVTILESYRGALKYRVMELSRYNQMHGLTGLFVNQRSGDRWDVHDMAGGIGLAHNLDGTIIVDFGHVYFMDQQEDLEAKRGEFVRIARVLDCRLCNFIRKRIRVDITKDGFIRPMKTPDPGS